MNIPAENLDPVLKRLARAQGQLAAVIRMIEEERDCKDIVTQLSACTNALDRAGFALISTGLQRCIIDTDDESERAENLAAMEKLFLTLA
ncbi:metal-sensitive transcriptional regulator [Mobilicoccus massiliensis]|uniref:metal-sensitive transcriptional regulator n=1 Tax=Mobilicoccus massiliensis TaxID=1522310 RepID=UPI00058E0499|nr:metal-sensitive transcriptional regulator [Mobilicoccus massiliensis]